MIKICLQCGKTFKTYQWNVNHCSRKCAIDALHKSVTVTCAFCGQHFERPPHRIKGKKNVFCSRDCHLAWRRARMPYTNCAVCGKRFYQQNPTIRHCSAKCADQSQVTAVYLNCENCGKTFRAFKSAAENGRRFCSVECAQEFMVGENSAHYRGGKELAHGRNWQAICRDIRRRDKVCQNCGAKRSPGGRRLDIHHIKARRDFKHQDEANQPDNLVALCAPCHSLLEMAITHGNVQSLPTHLKVLALAAQSSAHSHAASWQR